MSNAEIEARIAEITRNLAPGADPGPLKGPLLERLQHELYSRQSSVVIVTDEAGPDRLTLHHPV